MKIPLMVLGMAALMAFVVGSEKGFPLTAAVLIVGTIVAREDFLLEIARQFSTRDTTQSVYWQAEVGTGTASAEPEAVQLATDRLTALVTERVDEAVATATTELAN